MNHEVEIRQDPNMYNPRNIFGVFDARTFAVAVAIVAVVTPIVILAYMFNLPSELVVLLLVLFVVPIAMFGLAKRHGLHAEKWMPLAKRAKTTPQELVWEAPTISVTAEAESPTREQKRAAKAAKRARAKENELEGHAFSDALEAIERTN